MNSPSAPVPASMTALDERGTRNESSAERAFGVVEVGQRLVGEADTLERALVKRLIDDPMIPGAVAGDEVEIADHLSAFLAAVGPTLSSVRSGGRHPDLLKDGSEIQRMIAFRHGRQRRRLGWEAAALQREYTHLHELLDGALHQGAPPSADAGRQDGLHILHSIVQESAAAALAGFEGRSLPEPDSALLQEAREALESTRATIAAYRQMKEGITTLLGAGVRATAAPPLPDYEGE